MTSPTAAADHFPTQNEVARMLLALDADLELSGNYALPATNGLRYARCTGSPVLTLPAATTSRSTVWRVINAGAGTVTVAPAGTDTINGSTTPATIAPGRSMTFARSDAAAWVAPLWIAP